MILSPNKRSPVQSEQGFMKFELDYLSVGASRADKHLNTAIFSLRAVEQQGTSLSALIIRRLAL